MPQLLYRDAFSTSELRAALRVPGELLGASHVCLYSLSAPNRVLGQRSLTAAIQGVLGCGAVLKKQKQPKNFPFHLRNLIFMKETELQ